MQNGHLSFKLVNSPLSFALTTEAEAKCVVMLLPMNDQLIELN